MQQVSELNQHFQARFDQETKIQNHQSNPIVVQSGTQALNNTDSFRQMAKHLIQVNMKQSIGQYFNYQKEEPEIAQFAHQQYVSSRSNTANFSKRPSIQPQPHEISLQPVLNKRRLQINNNSIPLNKAIETTRNEKSAVFTQKSPKNQNQQQKAVNQNLLSMQKHLLQQFQILKIVKSNKLKAGIMDLTKLNANQIQPCSTFSQMFGRFSNIEECKSQAVEYGFDISEEEMYQRLYKRPYMEIEIKEHSKVQPYASFDCGECVQMALLLIEEELKQLTSGKKSQPKKTPQSKEEHLAKTNHFAKGIKGFVGVRSSLTKQKNPANQTLQLNGLPFQQQYQQSKPRNKSQSQMSFSCNKGPRTMTAQNNNEESIIGSIYQTRLSPQIVFKGQPTFKSIVKGEQLQSKPQPQLPCSCPKSNCMCMNLFQGLFPPENHMIQQQIQMVQTIQMVKAEQERIEKIEKSVLKRRVSLKPEKKVQIQSEIQGSEAMRDIVDGVAKGSKKLYPPAKINQSFLKPLTHLDCSLINQTILKINELVMILFKQKIKPNEQQITKLLKHFQIAIPRCNGVQFDWNMLKQPDFLHMLNQKLIQRLYNTLNQENNRVKPEKGSNIFRFHVGKGNNHPSVRLILQHRSWWNRGTSKQERFYGQNQLSFREDGGIENSPHMTSVEVIEQQRENAQLIQKQFSSGCHFIWTQWRKNEHIEFLKRVNCDKKLALDVAMGRTTNVKGDDLLFSNVPTLIYNRLEDNFHLSNKKALFRNISSYYRSIGLDPFQVAIPLTFNIKYPDERDPEYLRFTKAYSKFQREKDANIWIIKPGENTNRGYGITLAQSQNEIKNLITSLSANNGMRTSIVQKYLDKPLLIHGRKFDIRGYAMLTSINGVLKGYMYRDCYFRTSSKQFDLSNLENRFIHLTNDAIQQNSEDYGKFESGNKLSINDFQKYLDNNHTNKNVVFMRDLFPQMERLVTDSFRAVGSRIDPNRVSNCFEIFGYDFMIDENFKVFLIEANTNPCLEICCPLLARLISELLDNSFRIAIDPLFQPSQFILELNELQKSARGEPEITLQPNNSSVQKITSPRNIKESQIIGVTNLSQQSQNLTKPLGRRKQSIDDEGKKKEKGQFKVKSDKKDKNKLDRQNTPMKKLTLDVPSTQKDTIVSKKRQRVELLPIIKYTLIYDQRVDQPHIDQITRDYEQQERSCDIQSIAVAAANQAQQILQKDDKVTNNINININININMPVKDSKPCEDELLREIQEEEAQLIQNEEDQDEDEVVDEALQLLIESSLQSDASDS